MKLQLTLFVLLLITVYAEQHGQTTKNENDNSLLFFIFLIGLLYLLRHTSEYVEEQTYGDSSGSDEEADDEDDSEGEEEDEEDEEEQTEGEDPEEEEISDAEEPEEVEKNTKKTKVRRRSRRIGKTPSGEAY